MNPNKELSRHNGVEIVRLPITEWQSYKSLRLRALKEDPQAFGSSYEKEIQHPDEKWQSRLADNELLVFAKMNGLVVGMMGAFQTDSDKISNSATVYGVYVSSEARGKGISGKLIEELLNLLKGNDIATANLTVNKDQQAAVGLYKKYGFWVTGEEESIMGDGLKHTELLMAKKLSV